MNLHIIFFVSFLTNFIATSELPPWHLKPLGNHITPDPVDETYTNPHDRISAQDFATKYILPRKPLVFRNIVKSWPAYRLWTDEYLSERYGDMEMRLEAKKEKRGRVPKGDVCLGRDTLRKFLGDYIKGEDKYVVSELPTPMWGDVHLPPPMGCGELVESMVEVDVWMNSDTGRRGAGGNSLLHKDAYNTFNCVINGSKEWKLVELQYNDHLYQSWEGPLDAGYGGFSLIDPERVDAREYPDIGKVPRWQFVKVDAGDCVFVPSQMWHQVKSYGRTNKAVAFLFSQFQERDSINTTGCDVAGTTPLPLSQVDVDLQYPGTGLMTMGHPELEVTRSYLRQLVDEKHGRITKQSTVRCLLALHAGGNIVKKVMVQKAKKLYQLLLNAAGGKPELMNEQLIGNLTRSDIRGTLELGYREEPSNSYNYEYSHILSEDIATLILSLQQNNDGQLQREEFIRAYEDIGGTTTFGKRLWQSMGGGDKEAVEVTSDMLREALRPYDEHRRDAVVEEDEDATVTTPQGHITQPKRRKGGYHVQRNVGGEEEVENVSGRGGLNEEFFEEVSDVRDKQEL